MNSKKIGKYAFWAGLILAVVIALVPTDSMSDWAIWAMIALGLVGGYLRVSEKSEIHFFVLTLALAAFGNTLHFLPTIGEPITQLLGGVTSFLGVAVIAVAVRNIVSWFR